MLTPMKRTNHRDAVDAIAGWIVGGAPIAGSALPTEPEICERLGVSRTVVREAVKTLIAKGLVTSGPRVGTRVQPVDRWNLFDPDVIGWRLAAGVDAAFIADVIELRLALEPMAAGLAARRATEVDVNAMDAALTRMARGLETAKGDDKSWLEGDLAFHGAILTAAHNPFLIALRPLVEAILKVSFHFSVTSVERAAASLPYHRAVRDAIAGRDPQAAAARLDSLIRSARDDIEASMAPGQLVRGTSEAIGGHAA
jgi:DNA-binding FadR family transcriptional regulator